MKPDFIGIGVQKCATSWINRILSSHPQIVMPTYDTDKETRYFSCFYDRGYEWYERHFSHKEGMMVSGEFSTSYFYNHDIPQRIYDYNPAMKLIVCFREPLSRIISNHKHELRMKNISGRNMYLDNALSNNPMYVHQSLYYTHLKKWLEVFPQEQLLILIHEEIVCNYDHFIKELFQFLDVDQNIKLGDKNLTEKVNESRLPVNKQISFSKRGLANLMRKLGLGRLVSLLRARGLGQAISKVNTTNDMDEFTQLNEQNRHDLQKTFNPEIECIERLLGRELSVWKK